MRNIVLLLSSCIFLNANAMDINDALGNAYKYNPELKAKREEVKATDEKIMQSLSNFLPTVTVQRTKKHYDYKNYNPNISAPTGSYVDGDEASNHLRVNQNIFRGFGDLSRINAAKNQIRAARAELLMSEQKVLLDAVKAYLKVVSSAESLKVYENKVSSYRKLVYSVKEKFKAGEATKTDVAQAEAHYSQAVSDHIGALGNLETSRAEFRAVTGEDPIGLKSPVVKFAVPANVDDAVSIAQKKNPNIFISKYSKDAAESGINAARSSLLPSADFQFSRDRQNNAVGLDAYNNTTTLSLSVPLFSGGKNWSGLREAKRKAASSKYSFRNIQNIVFNKAVEAWQGFESSKASMSAREDALESAKIAWEGVKIEEQAGTRDTTEVIVVQNNYFDTNIRYINERMNLHINYFNLKAQLGELTAKDLGLKVPYYDPLDNYNKITKQLVGSF